MAARRFKDADDTAIRLALNAHDRIHPVLKVGAAGPKDFDKFVCSCGETLEGVTEENAKLVWTEHVIDVIRGPGL